MSLISESRCCAAARLRVTKSLCAFLQRAGDAVEQQRRVADDGVERRAELVRHAGEKVRLELVRLRQLLRLPEQPLVLLREILRRGGDAALELTVELLERLVQSLVLRLLREVVETDTIAIGSPRSLRILPDTTSTGSSTLDRGCVSDMRSRRVRSLVSAKSEMNDVNFMSFCRTACCAR